MRILITGASGFIGGHLVQQLAPAHELFALQRRLPANPLPGVCYLHQDLGQPLDHAILPDRLDVIIHQAALIDTAQAEERMAFAVNVAATWELLRYAQTAGVHSFVHASTGGVYGCRNRPFVESDPYNPMDLYSLTKAQAELAVQAAPGDFHKIVLRYFFPYGVGTPNPIPRWVRQAVTGTPLEITASGKPALNPLHITDALEATQRALLLEQNAIINIAGPEITTIAEIANQAAHLVGRQPNLVTVPDQAVIPYYRADLVADIQQMQRLLNFMPRVPLASGLAELVESATSDRQTS